MSEQEKPEGPTPGYYRKPHQLRTDTIDLDGTTYKFVDFIADMTFGWGARWVILSQDEIIYGKRRANGEHMPDLRSGLKEKKSIKKAIDAALEAGLLEVRNTRWGTAYAIHRRYWGFMPFAPKWEIFGFIYHDPETDPLSDVPSGGLNPPTDDANPQINAATGVLNPPDNNTESTRQYYSTHQPVILKQPAESRGIAQGEARDERIDTSLNTSKIDKIRKDTFAASPIGSPPSIPISKEKTEDEHNTLQAPRSERNDAPGRGNEDIPPAPTAEVIKAREQQMRDYQATYREWMKARDNAKTAKRLGKYAGETQEQWEEEARKLDAELEQLREQGSQE